MNSPSVESERKTSVLILATTVPVASSDGTPSFVLDLASVLAQECLVTILAPRVAGAPRTDEKFGVTIVRFPYFPRRWEGLADDAIMPTLKSQPWRWLEVMPLVASMAWQTWRITARDRFDVVNAHWIVPAGLVARLVSIVRDVPYIVTIHGADAYTLTGRAASFAKGSILRHAAVSVPVSRDIAGRARSIAGDRATISEPTPMGVAPVEPNFVERSPNTFLFVGRLAEKKGLDVALNALVEVADGELRIIGDGPEMERLRSLTTRLGLDRRVTFLGRRSRSQVMIEMLKCTALLIPSVVASDGDTDGTPVVLAEAMASGTPVVASRIAGLADYVDDGETGILVEPGSSDELGSVLNRMLADSELVAALSVGAAEYFPGSSLDVRQTANDYLKHISQARR